MNDFTKEQLIDLNVVLCVWNAKYTGNKSLLEVQDILLNLIDNYCDHEWEQRLGELDWLACLHCGENKIK